MDVQPIVFSLPSLRAKGALGLPSEPPVLRSTSRPSFCPLPPFCLLSDTVSRTLDRVLDCSSLILLPLPCYLCPPLFGVSGTMDT